MTDEEATKILKVARDCADGYRRSVTDFDTDAFKDTAAKCAIAASNTGWFILTAFGYSSDQIRKFTADGRRGL